MATFLVETETNLAGTLQSAIASSDGNGATFTVAFFDTKTGEARTPQATTLTFVINKDSKKFERIRLASHSTTAGVTTCVIATNGRNLPLFGTGDGTTTGFQHSEGAPIGCVVDHEPISQINALTGGTAPTGSNTLRVGDEADTIDKKFAAANGDTNEPFLAYDVSANTWVFSNDGTSTSAIGSGATSVTGGTGINVTASVVSLELADTAAYVSTSAGVADASKLALLNASGKFDLSFITTGAGSDYITGAGATVTGANLTTLTDGSDGSALHTHKGVVSLTAGEALLQGDFVGITADNTVQRVYPTTYPITGTSDVTITTSSESSGWHDQAMFDNYAVLMHSNGVTEKGIVNVTLDRAAGTITSATLPFNAFASNITDGNIVAAGTNKVLVTLYQSTGTLTARALSVPVTTTGSATTVASTNVSEGYGVYIDDSHVLIFTRNTSLNTIQCSKYTLSGTNLTLSTTLTVLSESGTWSLEGAYKWNDTNDILLVMQHDTDGSLQAVIARYDTGSSNFSSVGTATNFTGTPQKFNNNSSTVTAAVMNDTAIFMTFSTGLNTLQSQLVYRSTSTDTTPLFGTLNTHTNASLAVLQLGKSGNFAHNDRSAFVGYVEQNLDDQVLEYWELNSAATDMTLKTAVASAYPNVTGFIPFKINENSYGLAFTESSADDWFIRRNAFTMLPSLGVASAATAAAATVDVQTRDDAAFYTGLVAGENMYTIAGGGNVVASTQVGTSDQTQVVGIALNTTTLYLQ